MKIDAKYLPDVMEQKTFIKTRMFENKKQLLGGQLELLMAADNKPAIDQTEYQMKQLITNLDIYQAELDKLGN